MARLKKAEKYSAAVAATAQVTAVTPSLLPTPSIPPLDTHVDVHVVSSSSSLDIAQSELTVLLILYSIDYLCIPSDDGY